MSNEVTKNDLKALEAKFDKKADYLMGFIQRDGLHADEFEKYVKKSLEGFQKFAEDSAKLDENVKKALEGFQKFTEDSAKFEEWVKKKLD